MAIAAIDVAAIFKLADAAGGRHLLLIVYLGMAIPALYFYGVFDTLQTTGTMRMDEEDVPGDAADVGGPVAARSGNEAEGRAVAGEGEALRWPHAVFIMVAGLLLLFFLRMPDKLRPWFDRAGDYGAPALLFAMTAWIVLRRRDDGRYRLGRWTSAALAFGTGALLLSDEWSGRGDIALLGSWWPLLFVLIGCELLAYSLRRRRAHGALSADMSAVLAAAAIAVTAYGITQYAELPYRWLDQWAAQRSGYTNFSEEKGFSYDKPAVSADVPAELKRIVIDNPNGSVRVERGRSERIVVESTVWIDSADRAEAAAAAEGTAVELVAGEETSIKTASQGFGDNGVRKPRVNIIVWLPPSIADAAPIDQVAPGNMPPDAPDRATPSEEASSRQDRAPVIDANPDDTGTLSGQSHSPSEPIAADESPLPSDDGETTDEVPEQPAQQQAEEHKPLELRIQIQSGDAEVFDIAAPVAVAIEVGNGTITAQRIAGTVAAKTVNGSVQLMQVADRIEASVSNGAIDVVEAGGNVSASTANGGIHLKQVLGDIEVETKNGEVSIREAAGRVKADTLNGTIEVYSGTVGGDWDIVGLVGDVRLQLPVDGSYELNGSVTFGQIRIDPALPLASVRKTARGIVGSGEHRIYVNANSSIVIAPFVR